MADAEKPKTKRAPSAWAAAVATHMKAGGKFPKKGTADYDAVKKLMGDKKPAEPKAEPKVEAKPKAVRKPKTEPKAEEPKVEPKAEEPKPKAPRKPRAPKEVPAPAPKEDIIVGKEVEVEHVIPEKPKAVRKPRTPKAVVPAESESDKEPEKVSGREVSVAHVIPMMRVSAGRGMMKLPFA